MCGQFGTTRQAYYAMEKRIEEVESQEEKVLEMVRQVRSELPRLGVRKLYILISFNLLSVNIKMGRDALFNLLRREEMLIRSKKRSTKTTDSRGSSRDFPDLTIGFTPTSAGQLWVSDITYIAVKEGFIYLFLTTDAYSRKIVGYCLSDNMKAENAVTALRMAQQQYKVVEGVPLIHHSDRGKQYDSAMFKKAFGLDENNASEKVLLSMTQNSDPRENALAERVNGILKEEWFCEMKFVDLKQAIPMVGGVIEKYNTKRPHSSCDMNTPEQAHLMTGELKKHWKNYYLLNRDKEAVMPDVMTEKT